MVTDRFTAKAAVHVAEFVVHIPNLKLVSVTTDDNIHYNVGVTYNRPENIVNNFIPTFWLIRTWQDWENLQNLMEYDRTTEGLKARMQREVQRETIYSEIIKRAKHN